MEGLGVFYGKIFCGLMKLRTVGGADFGPGTKALVRADFDVFFEHGKAKSTFRIQSVVPLLKILIKRRAQIRIISHLGRPMGKKVLSMSMRSIALRLGKLLRRKIIFVTDPRDDRNLKKYINSPDIIFFENIRFWQEEEANDPNFVEKLSRWGDIYINEAFANSHRRHASIVGLPKVMPAFAGPHLEKEVFFLSHILRRPLRPFVAIIGGAKFETKLPLLRKFSKIADSILVGGALANSFMRARGFETGRSVIDKILAKDILHDKKIILPCDVVTTRSLQGKSFNIKSVENVDNKDLIADIGPKSVRIFSSILESARTVVWNGPLGYAEISLFMKGTEIIARTLARKKIFRVLGGGDTIRALENLNIRDKFTHVSTGGGAMLEFLADGKLPGIEALKNSKFKNF